MIKNQQIEKIVRQSEGYYIYLTNNARILVQKFGDLIYFIPAKNTGEIEKYEAKNCMDAIRKYIKKHNLKN